ncbi:hypothetical protein [Paenibacillus sp. FSL R5-0470]|uniref:hypothetical protein n=1 Tax=Paenibacillus sp. FSL R5-0470 TaxID=2921641 RepID=UPI0030DD243D
MMFGGAKGDRIPDLIAASDALSRRCWFHYQRHPEAIKNFPKKQHAIHSMDFIGTTLSGYTPHDPRSEGPDLELVRWMSESLCVTVRRGRRIRTPEEAASAMRAGAAYVGGRRRHHAPAVHRGSAGRLTGFIRPFRKFYSVSSKKHIPVALPH